MSAWDGVKEAIRSGALERTARLVSELDEPARRAVAKELPGALKELRAASEHGFLPPRVAQALLLAGAGTIGGAAAAAAWMCRADLRPWWDEDVYCPMLCDLTSIRPDGWRAEVAHRIAARLKPSEQFWTLWHIAAALARSAGAAPVSDGFVVGWVAEGGSARRLAEDPFLDALVPRLFEADGVGAALAFDAARTQPDETRKGAWAAALADLAHAGRLDRTALLDGCISRFLRGGTAHNLRWFVGLHEELRPTGEEAAARVRDYVRLLPVAPPTVADAALRQVRRADDLERLDDALFEEAADALLFRPEKKLVRAALTWLDRTARARGRVDATLRAVPAVFASESLDLRERAVKIAVKHASLASDGVRAEVRDAAADLPADLRQAVAAAFGEVAEAAPEPVPLAAPPPFTPREAPAPIGSLTELGSEFLDCIAAGQRWQATERFLGALVEFAYRDLDGTRKALQEVCSDRAPWLLQRLSHSHARAYVRGSWVEFPVRKLLLPDDTPAQVAKMRAAFVKGRTRLFRSRFLPPIERFLAWRRHEIVSVLSTVPVLLATPTEGSGQIDPGVLVARLERLEEAGAEPGRADLAQAMLRVPREIDPAAVARAKGLASDAGRAVASWLATGGLADPGVECTFPRGPITSFGEHGLPHPAYVMATVDVPGRSDVARICAISKDAWTDHEGSIYNAFTGYWPSVMPSHREVAAAHLLPCFAGTEDVGWGQGTVMLDLAEADGPAGTATGTLLACALANKEQHERATAVEAFLALLGRGHLPAAETGTALGRLAAAGAVTVSRTVKSLADAADAGAHAEVWTVLAAALPHVLPAPGVRAPAGLPDLLALATRTAEVTGARGAIPAVAEVASRGGSSRLVKESARLHRTVLQPPPTAIQRTSSARRSLAS
ncbi:hypothetical protein E1264_14795 [Actinomadura sp. KC216]|uniref:DUF6493 family protein n=1 Tax=Actinomadura sp. KC216 TaxID=2530370 RepID=UPI00105149D5|nr:DUF6493 family protein [Actinomadura sp. KC216]TDB87358.1 hypothetical protein E1264_14795 [Actinomadura sp. KC216]